MKKLNESGFSHVEIMLVGIVLIIITLVGAFVWRSNGSQQSASAGGFRVLAEGGGVTLHACRGTSPQNGGVRVKAVKTAKSSVATQRASVAYGVSGTSGASANWGSQVSYGYPEKQAAVDNTNIPWGVAYQLRDEDGSYGGNPNIRFFIEYKRKTGQWVNSDSQYVHFKDLQSC